MSAGVQTPETAAEPQGGPAPPRAGTTTLARTLELSLHLVRRDIAVTNRDSVIGAAWPLLRQLLQLTVLVVAFSAVLDLGIPDYPVFVFCGLIGWSWFVAAMGSASTVVRGRRELAMRPGFPTIVLPIVATAVPVVDVVVALPVLAVMLAASSELHATAPLLLVFLVVQGVLTLGLGWLIGAAAVPFRDIPNIVSVTLTMGFYLTPVYFDASRVPDQYQWLLHINPMAVLLQADRAVLLGTPFPPAGVFAAVVVLAGVLFAAGLAVFLRAAPGFSDEL